jgi:uncharacterized protein (TIGR03083 family)
MSHSGIRGMRAAGDDALALAAAMSDDQWRTPSAAQGWSVKDVFLHMGALLELLQAAIGGAEVPPTGIEELNEQVVAERRDWSPTRTIGFLRDQLETALAAFTALQDEPMASTETALLDLGNYPLHAIPDMFSFDLTAHLRYDVLRPRGPIDLPVPALDEARLAPAVSWLVRGLSQMQPELAGHLEVPITVRLVGPGARQIQLTATGEGVRVAEPPDADTPSAATLTSTTADFLGWSTRRLLWTPLVHVDGDTRVAESFLDTVNLI